ncbi:hypothetical protein [Streptomyces alfalfae]
MGLRDVFIRQPKNPQERARAAQAAAEGTTDASRARRQRHRNRVIRDGDAAGVQFRSRSEWDDG